MRRPMCSQLCAQALNLRAFPGAIDSRKADEFRAITLASCTHYRCSRMTDGAVGTLSTWLAGTGCETAATIPSATPAPRITPTPIRIARTRRCFAGAIAAPAGRDAVTPMAITPGPQPCLRVSQRRFAADPGRLRATALPALIALCDGAGSGASGSAASGRAASASGFPLPLFKLFSGSPAAMRSAPDGRVTACCKVAAAAFAKGR